MIVILIIIFILNKLNKSKGIIKKMNNTMFDTNITKMDVIDLLLLPTYNATMLLIYDKYFENML